MLLENFSWPFLDQVYISNSVVNPCVLPGLPVYRGGVCHMMDYFNAVFCELLPWICVLAGAITPHEWTISPPHIYLTYLISSPFYAAVDSKNHTNRRLLYFQWKLFMHIKGIQFNSFLFQIIIKNPGSKHPWLRQIFMKLPCAVLRKSVLKFTERCWLYSIYYNFLCLG